MHRFFVFNKKKISDIVFGIIFLLPLLRYYDVPIISISVETALILLLCILCFMLKRVTVSSLRCAYINRSRNAFLFFFMWFYLITMIYEFGTNINIHNAASHYSLMTFVILLPTGYVLYSLLDGRWSVVNIFKLYSFFVKIIIATYIFQYILQFIGIFINFKIPFFSYNDSWNYLNNIVFGMNKRPTSLFSEQAHLAEYLLPYLAICLYSEIYERRLLKAVMVTFVLVSTTSGNGIIGALVLWSLYILIYAKINLIYRVSIIIIGVFFVMGIYQYLLTLPAYKHIFGELFVNTTGKYSGTKADYRIYRGFDYFRQLPLVQKIFGVGYQHMHAFSYEYGIVSKYDSNTNAFEFFSTITQVLLYSGVIGGMMFVRHIYYLWKEKNMLAKGILLGSIAIWFSSQMLFTNTYIMYIALTVSALLYRKQNINESAEESA